jgi:hypothetical protein
VNDTHIELTYTALAECIGRVGKDKTPLLLATLALELLIRLPDADAALEHISSAERLTRA